MKIHNLIKADFFIDPENYGFYAHDDLKAIWNELIKPTITEIEIVDRIDNTAIYTHIKSYRLSVMNMLN
jgi:hypothetical protein